MEGVGWIRMRKSNGLSWLDLVGLWEILGLYFGHRAPKIQANTGSTEGEIHAYFGAQSTRRLVMHYIVK